MIIQTFPKLAKNSKRGREKKCASQRIFWDSLAHRQMKQKIRSLIQNKKRRIHTALRFHSECKCHIKQWIESSRKRKMKNILVKNKSPLGRRNQVDPRNLGREYPWQRRMQQTHLSLIYESGTIRLLDRTYKEQNRDSYCCFWLVGEETIKKAEKQSTERYYQPREEVVRTDPSQPTTKYIRTTPLPLY